MTGANDFTRKAGLAGLLSLVLGAAGLLLVRPWDGARSPSDAAHALRSAATGLSLLCVLVLMAGLAVRHRHHPLVGGARWLVPAALLVAAFTGDARVAGGAVGLATLLVLLAVAIEDDLPRPAAVLVLAAPAFGSVHDLLGVAVFAVAWAWLSWAMWREPLPGVAQVDEALPART